MQQEEVNIHHSSWHLQGEYNGIKKLQHCLVHRVMYLVLHKAVEWLLQGGV